MWIFSIIQIKLVVFKLFATEKIRLDQKLGQFLNKVFIHFSRLQSNFALWANKCRNWTFYEKLKSFFHFILSPNNELHVRHTFAMSETEYCTLHKYLRFSKCSLTTNNKLTTKLNCKSERNCLEFERPSLVSLLSKPVTFSWMLWVCQLASFVFDSS